MFSGFPHLAYTRQAGSLEFYYYYSAPPVCQVAFTGRDIRQEADKMAGIVCYLISRIPMFLFSLYGPLYAAYALFICGNPKVNAITRARFPENGFRKTCAHFPGIVT